MHPFEAVERNSVRREANAGLTVNWTGAGGEGRNGGGCMAGLRSRDSRERRSSTPDNAFTSTVELSMNPSPAAYAMYGPRCCCCDRIPDIMFPTNKPVGWSFSILPCGGHHIMGVGLGLDW